MFTILWVNQLNISTIIWLSLPYPGHNRIKLFALHWYLTERSPHKRATNERTAILLNLSHCQSFTVYFRFDSEISNCYNLSDKTKQIDTLLRCLLTICYNTPDKTKHIVISNKNREALQLPGKTKI